MKNKITLYQYFSLVIYIIISSFLGIGVYSLFKSSKVDAIFSIFTVLILTIIIYYLIIEIINFKKDLPLNEKINYLYGKKIGFFFNGIFIFFIASTSLSFIFNLNHFIITQFLSETKLILVEFVFGIVICYINIKGINAILQTSQILFVMTILLFLTATISLIFSVKISNFLPILEFGIKPTIYGGIRVFLLNYVPLFMILTIPKNYISKNEKYNKYLSFSIFLSTLIIYILIFLTLGTLGINLSTAYQYPEYIILKRIELFHFIDQVENIINFQWIFGLFILISFCVYSINNTIKTNNHSKILPIIIFIILTLLTNLLFKNITVFNHYIYHIAPYIRLGFLIYIIFIFISIKIKKYITV